MEFYEQKFGPGDQDALPGKCRWLSQTQGDWVSSRLVVVGPSPAAASQATGAGKRTSIYIGRRDGPVGQG